MKVAYLIIAHNQPTLVSSLVRSLACDWAWFFIHVDAKAEIAPFQRLVEGCPNVMFLEGESRVKVYWGGFSQVQTTLNLLATAEAFAGGFSRYCLLSGSDFPIKPLAVIRQRLESDREFMRVDRRVEQPGVSADRHSQDARRYFFMDLPLPRLIKRRLLSGWIPRRLYSGIPLYHGAQWWSLSGGCVRYIMQFVHDNPSYPAFCRHLLSADEIFFHSIVKQSPFAGRITHDFERASDLPAFYASNDHGCHYIDWNARLKVLPKTLSREDLPALDRSSALFARKFDAVQSLELLQLLEGRMRAERDTSAAMAGGQS